ARAIYELLAKADPAGFNPALAGLLGNLGSTLGSQRRYAESVAVCEAALAIYEQLVARDAATYTPSLAMTLANLGTTFNRLPDYDRAIRTYERARAYYESLAAASPAIYGAPLAQVCNNLGAALNSKGEHAAALTAARAAVATLRPLAADNPSIYTPPYAGYLFNLGRALVGTGDREAAEAQYQEALMLCDDSVRRDGGQQPDVVAVRWRILAELGRLDDDLAARRRYFADALALLEEQRGLLANRDDRQAFQGEYATLYGEMVACCVALAAGLPPAARQDLLAEAWRWSERGRGRALLDLLGSPRPRLKTATQRQLFEDWEAARHAVDRALHEFSQAGAELMTVARLPIPASRTLGVALMATRA
ncbi:MAG: tetratricopeptide repeat protein, partial [Chloroflexia bacterium]